MTRPTTDLGAVLGAIARTAAELCEATDALIYLVDGERHRLVAKHGAVPQPQRIGDTHPVRRDTPLGRAVLDRRAVHVADITRARGRFVGLSVLRLKVTGVRTVLAMPLLHDGVALGGIVIRRTRVRPFLPKQISLLKTFADQAAIAIENARLSEALQARNRALTEALEQQTATSEILKVISRSTTDVQPVFDAIAQNAALLCDALFACVFRFDGALIHFVAHHRFVPEALEVMRRAWPAPPKGLVGASIVDRAVVHAPDVLNDPRTRNRELAEAQGYGSYLGVPMLHGDRAMGVISVYHAAARPFSDKQIALLQTFADQAVIAVENVRLFKELEARNAALTDALEQQTATAEILRIISQSPTDLAPVLQAVAERAARLCGASDAQIYQLEHDGILRRVASYGSMPTTQPRQGRPPGRGWVTGRAVADGRTVRVADLAVDVETEFPDVKAYQAAQGTRSAVATPLLREERAIGAILIRRTEVRPFSDAQVHLLETFATQAVIAIENVRLFTELQGRNRALTEALDQQTATGEILRVISSSPTDLAPVFDIILASATRLCDAHIGLLSLVQDGHVRPMADHGTTPEFRQWWYRAHAGRPPDPRTGVGRMLQERRPVHIPDVRAEPLYAEGEPARVATVDLAGARTFLAVPMLKEGAVVGGIVIYCREVRPFTDQQIALVQTFANQAVIAIENVRLFNELQARTRELTRSVEQLTALGEVGQAVSSTLDLETVLTTIASRAAQLAATDTCTVYEYDEPREEFHLRATHNVDERVLELTRVRPIRKGEGVTGRVAQTRAPVQVEDIAREEAYQGRLREALLAAGVRSVLAIPLLREDRLIGVLIVTRSTPGRFADEITALLQTFATQSAIAIQNARLYRELEAKGRELEAASRHKSQFLANMSHELRTPMNAILGYTELMADGIYGGVPEPMRDVLGRVEASGRHLLGLINDVLDLSKIEAGQLTLTLADYSMKEVVDAVVSAVEALVREKHLRLLVDLAPDLPTGRGDQRRLAQVLLNLVGNAIKFTEQGEIAIRIGAAGGLFTAAVSDTGPGIAPADQERIFEEFQQADASTTRPKGGTGLGLAIARRIIAMHGGRIWVESVRGEGATFRFTMPVRVEQPVVMRAGAA